MKKKKFTFKKILLLWCAFILFAGFIGCLIFYKYCGIYEKSRPEPIMEELLESMSAEDFIESAKCSCSFETGPFENPLEIYTGYIEKNSLEGKLSYRKEITQSDSERVVYSVNCGSAKLARVTLCSDGNDYAFSRHGWKLESISAPDLSSVLGSAEAFVFAPAGERVFVEGIELGAEYSAGFSEADFPRINSYETASRLSELFCEYSLGLTYGNLSVTDEDGNPAESFGTESGIAYVILPESSFSVKITAPADAKVFVNSVEIPSSEAKISRGALEGLEDYVPSGHETAEYNISDLLAEPQITAVSADGSILEPVYAGASRYSFMEANDEATEEELGHYAEEFFSRYMKYSSAAFAYESQGSLLNRTLRHSSLYDYILNSADAMYWASSTETEYDSLSFGNFKMLSDSCFVCSVSYRAKMTAQKWAGSEEYYLSNSYELVFVKTAESEIWLCAAMNAISE